MLPWKLCYHDLADGSSLQPALYTYKDLKHQYQCVDALSKSNNESHYLHYQNFFKSEIFLVRSFLFLASVNPNSVACMGKYRNFFYRKFLILSSQLRNFFHVLQMTNREKVEQIPSQSLYITWYIKNMTIFFSFPSNYLQLRFMVVGC